MFYILLVFSLLLLNAMYKSIRSLNYNYFKTKNKNSLQDYIDNNPSFSWERVEAFHKWSQPLILIIVTILTGYCLKYTYLSYLGL